MLWTSLYAVAGIWQRSEAERPATKWVPSAANSCKLREDAADQWDRQTDGEKAQASDVSRERYTHAHTPIRLYQHAQSFVLSLIHELPLQLEEDKAESRVRRGSIF